MTNFLRLSHVLTAPSFAKYISSDTADNKKTFYERLPQKAKPLARVAV
jgi:hypothetical protein